MLLSALDHLLEHVDLVIELGVALAFLSDLSHGVHDGRVVSAAEVGADFGEAVLGQLLGEVHGNLARPGDVGGAALRMHFRDLDVVVVGDGLLDALDRDQVVVDRELVAKDVLGDVDCDFLGGRRLELLVGDDLLKGALKRGRWT